MGGWMDRVLTRLSRGESISDRLRISFLILMGLLVIPALVSVSMMMHYAQTYHSVIRQVERVSSLKPLVQTQIADEMWYVVAGHKSFDGGEQYAMINHVNGEIDALSRSADPGNLTALVVARRTMGTLENYIDRMGELIRTEQPIAESEALLEEVRNVSSLVADMLAEYADGEISAAARASDRLQDTLTAVLLILLAQLLSALKKWDCWIAWLVVNVTQIILHIKVGHVFMPIVCALYLINGIWSLYSWVKTYKKGE